MNYYLISLIVGLIVFLLSLYALSNSYSTICRVLFIVTGMIGAFLLSWPIGSSNVKVEVPYIVADKKIENINLDMKFVITSQKVCCPDRRYVWTRIIFCSKSKKIHRLQLIKRKLLVRWNVINRIFSCLQSSI